MSVERVLPPAPTPLPASPVCRFGVFEVHLSSHRIFKAGREIHLQEQPLRLLLLLIECPGELRTREELQRRLWPNDTFVEFDDGLNTAIQKIRQVLGDEARNPRFVETVPRQGYRFIAPVRVDVPAAAPVAPPGPAQPAMEPAPPIPVSRRRPSGDWRIAAVCAAAVGIALGWGVSRRSVPSAAPLLRLTIPAPAGVELRHGIRGGSAISPDGQTIVFAGSKDGQHQLWLRRLDSVESKPLPGTDDAVLPFWSPDGRSIGFQAAGRIRRLDIAGGPPQDLAVATRPTRGAWTDRGEVLFATGSGGPIQSVPVTNGGALPPARVVAQSKSGGVSWPVAIPGSDQFLFFENASRRVHRGSVTGAIAGHTVLTAAANAIYAPPHAGHPGYLLWMKGNTLVAQAYEQATGALSPEIAVIAGDIGFADRWWMMDATVSANGVLAYGNGNSVPSRLAWVRRDGTIVRHVGGQDRMRSVRLAADGRRALVERGLPRSLWMLDFDRDVQTRVSFEQEWSGWPVWSPDGSQIAFSGERLGRVGLFLRGARDGQPATPLGGNGFDDFLYDWSRDGQYLIYTEVNPDSKLDLWILPLRGERKARPFLQTRFNEDFPQFSPDGRWVAYVSDESGRNEVYVASFPGAESKWQISTSGGSMPRWPASGELFFESSSGHMVAVETRPGGKQFEWSAPRQLFVKRMPGRSYDVAPQGDRLLMIMPDEGREQNELNVIINWPSALPRR